MCDHVQTVLLSRSDSEENLKTRTFPMKIHHLSSENMSHETVCVFSSQEKLGALVEHLCFEAVEKILKLVNLSVMKSGENVGQMHDGSDDVSETAGGQYSDL